MTAITFLLFTAAIGFGAARWLHLPSIPFLILGGVVVSALAPLPADFLEDALVLGLTVMVFVAGIELSPGRFRFQRNAAFQVGLAQFVVLGAIGMGAALLMGFNWETGAYLALALTASSTLVVVRLLQRERQLFEPFGRLVTGVLLFQDLLVVLLIPVVIGLPRGWAAVGQGVFGTLGLVGLAWVVLRWIAPFAVRRLAFDEESLLLVVLTILFSFLGLSFLFDLPLVSGAFLAGVSLSAFPVNALVRGQLNSLSDFFNALFFTALGAFLTLPSLLELFQVGMLVLIVVVVTPPLVAVIAERAGFSARPAIASGLLLAQTSEFSLVVALQGVVLGHVTPEVFTIIAFVTVVTMVLTPFLATDRVVWKLMRIHPFKRSDSFADPPENHILLLGCGRNGITLLELLIFGPHPVVVVDDDPALIEHIRESGIPALRGDVSDLEVLRSAGADRAKVVISTIRRKEDNGPLLSMKGDVPVLARAFNVEDGEWIRARGGHPISYADAAAEDFLNWFHEEWLPEGTGGTTAGRAE